MDKVRIGIIGCGDIARKKHVTNLLKHSDKMELVAFQDYYMDRANSLASLVPGAKVYADYRQLLEDKYIDAVTICTPHAMHSDPTVAALEAGKHVLCEKPMASNLEQAGKMLDASRRANKKLSISCQNRFRKDSKAIYQACVSGELGEIYFAKAHATKRKSVPTWGNFLKSSEGGGPLIDLGTHALDLTLWFMNNFEVESVTGSTFYKKMANDPNGNFFGKWDPEKFEVEDSSFGFIKMKNGATVFLESSWALNSISCKDASATLCGTKGGAEQFIGPYGPGSYSYAINKAMGDDPVTIRPDYLGGFDPNRKDLFDQVMYEAPYYEMDAWLNCLLNDTEPVVTADQAYTVAKILFAIYESSSTGKTIYFA